jgi:23S rRNA pseudouridine2605 synthase/23S rRNA pseudouridine2604 synthase
MEERLQKILSARGIASRRKAEEYITQGLVTVNGVKAILGQKADPEVDRIEVAGQVAAERAEMLYFVLNKPINVETTNVDSEERVERNMPHARTVRDLLPETLRGKIYPVGRLDKDSEGLLILTNDGVLANRLMHPKFDHEKEYEVTILAPIMDGALHKLREGVKIDGAPTKLTTIRRISPTVFRIILTEGRNRQIRRMCQKVGSEVIKLKRVRIMTLVDPVLPAGQMRKLNDEEKKQLLQSVGMESSNPHRNPLP